MKPQFTDSVAEALQAAYLLAEEKKQTELTESHLLTALLADPEGYFCTLIRSLNLSADTLKQYVQKAVDSAATFTSSPQPPFLLEDYSKEYQRLKSLLNSGKTHILVQTIYSMCFGNRKLPLLLPGNAPKKMHHLYLYQLLKNRSSNYEEDPLWIQLLPNKMYKSWKNTAKT